MKRILLACVLATAGVGCGHSSSSSSDDVVAQKDAERILEETPWMDHAPEDESDIIHLYIFQGEGLYFTGNAYKAQFERFRYYAEKDLLKLRFLDDGAKHDVHFKIERVRDRVFDYKLTLDGDPRGPSVYYGFDAHRALPDAVQAIVSNLPK
jgi:hypothetical protein